MVAAAAIGSLLHSSIAQAEVITYIYSGQVNTVFGPPLIDGIPEPFDGVEVGDQITVEYTLDTSTPELADIGTFSGAFMNFNYKGVQSP